MFKKGFTLLELLVVISIIGLLSSVVLASLASTKTKAQVAKVNIDKHTLDTAMELFYDDVGKYPGEQYLSGTSPMHNVPLYDEDVGEQLIAHNALSTLPDAPLGTLYFYAAINPENTTGFWAKCGSNIVTKHYVILLYNLSTIDYSLKPFTTSINPTPSIFYCVSSGQK